MIGGKVERCKLGKGSLQGVLVDLGRLVIEELSCIWGTDMIEENSGII